MATAIPFVLAGLSVAQGIQSYRQNQAMAKATTQQANAQIAQEKSLYEVKQKQLLRLQQQEAGKATVSAAASGATLGSFDTLFEDNYTQALMDQKMLEYDSKVSQENIRYNAAVQSSQYKSQAKSSLIGGVVNAGATLYTSGALNSSSSSGALKATAQSKTGGAFGGGFTNLSDGSTINWYKS